MAAVLAVGLTGGDVETAAFTAENAARYNSFMSVSNYVDRRHFDEQAQTAETDEERQFYTELMAQTNQHPLEQPIQEVNAFASHPLPDPILGPITSWNQALQRQIDQRERAFQEYNQIFPGLGTALMVANWQTTLGPYMAHLPTTRGGALITLAPLGRGVGTAGKVVVKEAQSLVKKVLPFAEKRLASTSATLGEASATKALQAANTLADKKIPSVLVRPGQEWRQKIHGTAQKTGTPGHAFRSYREAIEAAKKPDTLRVHMDHGYNRVTGEKIKSNRRPDVTVVKTDGTVHPIEVPSKTDKEWKLKERNNEALSKLPKHMRGEYKMKPIKKAKETK